MADGADERIDVMGRVFLLTERQGAMMAEIANLHRADEQQRADIKALGLKIDHLSTQIYGVRADIMTHIDKALAVRPSEPVAEGVKDRAREYLAVAAVAVILTYVAVTQMGVTHLPGGS